MSKFIASIAAALFVAAVGMAASPAAHAIAITHNGIGTGGIVAVATQAVDVELIDIAALDPTSDFAAACVQNNVDACLAKAWATTDTHTMVVVPDGAATVLGEFVFNFSGQSWTDYHVAVTGADLQLVGYGFFFVDGEGNIVNVTDQGISHQIDGNSLSLFFDQPFNSINGENGEIALGILISASETSTFTVDQFPTLPEPPSLAVFGIALAGIGFIRRRKPA